MATVKFTKEADAQKDALPAHVRGKMIEIVARLEKWPNVAGAQPLRHNLKGWFRIRVRDYRVRFYVVGDVVVIDKIGDRKDVYHE